MITVPSKIWHVFHVLSKLSSQNREEHKALGLKPWEVVKMAQYWIESDGAHTGLLDDGEPAVIFGTIKDASGYRTWFLATQKYWDLGMPAVLHARRFLKKLPRNGPILTGTAGNHPDLVRWFKLLGYEYVGKEGNVEWFKYA